MKLNTLYNMASRILLIIFTLMAANSLAEVEIEVTDATCNGKEDGKIDVTVTGENGPYSFFWPKDNSTEDHLYDIPKGNYILIITDKDGCTLTKEIEVGVEEDKPKVKLNGKGETFCEEEEDKTVTLRADISVCEGCIIEWSNNESSKTIEVNSSGEYWVKVTDQDECFDSDTLEIEIEIEDCEDENDEADIPLRAPHDPNDMLGPDGVGPQKWVSINDRLPYKIRFENDPNFATAPAQKVIVRSPISENLDIYSFRLSSFGFGDFVFEAPENSTFYSTRLDVSDSLDVLVDFIAGIDVVKREAFWIFESIDPESSLEPAADLGFLLVNDTVTRRGEGFVSFSIEPVSDAQTGDSIKAIADIVFDINGSILTPEIFNTIDAYPPTSTHRILDEVQDSVFTYAISAIDDFGTGGCGVQNYDLYLADESEGVYSLYASDIPIDSILYISGDPDKTYCAYTIAKDSVGNKEFKGLTDVCFSTKINPFIKITGPDTTQKQYCQGEYYVLNWIYSGIDSVNIYLSSDSGASYQPFAVKVPARHREFEWKIPLEETVVGENYVFKIADADSDTLFDQTRAFDVKQHVPVEILASVTDFCEGDSSLLSLNAAYDQYTWSTGAKTSTIVAKGSQIYKVSVSNANNCSSTDSVEIVNHGRPDKPIIMAGGSEFEVCPAKGLVLSAPLNFAQYQWSNGQETASITIHEPGRYAVHVSDANGCAALSDTVTVTQAADSVCQTVSVIDAPGLTTFQLEAYPNPFSQSTNIRIALPKPESVRLSLYHVNGFKVGDIFEGKLDGGKIYEIPYLARDLESGVYICKLLFESGEIQSVKLVVL